MKAAHAHAGVTIRTGAAVARILADRGTATGVVLATGETLQHPVIVSAIHPQATFLKLIDAAGTSTPASCASIGNIRTKGDVAKLHLALDRAARFHRRIQRRPVTDAS